jgi:4a-hydroxytetrahydrobiopterin dehydratase
VWVVTGTLVDMTTADTATSADVAALADPAPPAEPQVVRPAEVAHRVDPRHWRVLLYRLEAAFRTPDLATAAAFAGRVAAAAAATGTVPDLVVRAHRVHVRTTTPGRFGATAADLALATAVSDAADALGLAGAPETLTTQEVAIDALDIPAVVPFWRALLGYEPLAGLPAGIHVLADPHGTAPGYWFQQMDEPRPQRNRIHVDVTVPYDEADARVAAALAAGGRLVSDAEAPGFRVLADAEGNEACVCSVPVPVPVPAPAPAPAEGAAG